MSIWEKEQDGHLRYGNWVMLALLAAFMLLLPMSRAFLPDHLEEILNRAIVFGVFIAATVWSGSRAFAAVFGLVLVASMCLTVMGMSQPGTVFAIAWHILMLGAFLLIAVGILKQVLATRRVRLNTVIGALDSYLLFGLAFAVLHSLIAVVDTDAYDGLLFAEGAVLAKNSTYYSFVTITTLGYGDILPLTETSRAAAYLEALFGQAFIAVIVARFVAMEVTHSAMSASDQEE